MADEPDAKRTHPLLHSGKYLLGDLLSTLAFVGMWALTHSLALSMAGAIALGVGEIALTRMRGKRVEVMQWLSLFLVVVFGGASLMTGSPEFVMLKPTLIYAAVGLVMLKPGWMIRYMPPVAQERGADLGLVFGYVWSALMFATAVLNAAVLYLAGPAAWAVFIGVFPLASKLALFAVQYVVMRSILRRRIYGAAAVAPG